MRPPRTALKSVAVAAIAACAIGQAPQANAQVPDYARLAQQAQSELQVFLGALAISAVAIAFANPGIGNASSEGGATGSLDGLSSDGISPGGGTPGGGTPGGGTPGGGTPTPTIRTAYLSDIRAVELNRLGSMSARINGQSYSKSIGTGNTWSSMRAQYDLERKYSNFRATLGVSDNSRATDTVWRYQVYVDDVVKYDQTVRLGAPREINLDVRNGLRLRVDITRVSGGSSSYPAMGDPRLTW